MTKTLRFNSGSLGIGADTGPFTIFHTSKAEANKIADQVTKIQLDSGYSVSGVADDKFYFVIYDSGSGVLQQINLPSPSISSFTPTSGQTGQKIQITGSGFVGATQVTLGSIAAGSLSIKSNTSMSVEVTTGETGLMKITNPVGTGTSTGIFTFKTTPTTPVYNLGAYYYDLNDSGIVCGGSTVRTYTLYAEAIQSLTQGLNSSTVIYTDPGLTLRAPQGYYGVQNATYPGSDEGYWFFIDSTGKVTSSGNCSAPPPTGGGSGAPGGDGGFELP